MLRADASFSSLCWISMSPRASADPWGFFCSDVAAARSQCFNVLKGRQGRNKGRIGMREDNGATRDVARTYREALRREKKDLPAYNTALSVYLGHFPTMSHDAARQAVAEIIAADFQSRDRGH